MKYITKFCLISLLPLFLGSLTQAQTWTANSGNYYLNPTTANLGIGTTPSSTNKLLINTTTGVPFRVQISGNAKFTVASNGGVTIGMLNDTPPTNGLLVNGRIYTPLNSYIGIGASSTEGIARLMMTHSGEHGYIDYKENLYFRADNSYTSSLTLFGNGTVGVGFGTAYTAGNYRNLGFKLAVNGGIVCEEVKVILDVPDADYVFETDYNLKTIQEVEAYVNEHKHLQDIPSAEEFKKEGYKVGEMDEMLLRKIEEITLYLIEQNKRIEALEAENSALRNALITN